MPNPNPQHNPTDGLGVARFIHLTGTNLVPLVTPGSAGNLPADAVKYSLTQSLSSSGGKQAVSVLTASLVDVHNNAYTPSGSASSIAYVSPATAGFFKPSNFGSYNGRICSVANSGGNGLTVTITAIAVGTATVEVNFPTFDNTESAPAEKIYVLVDVTVIP